MRKKSLCRASADTVFFPSLRLVGSVDAEPQIRGLPVPSSAGRGGAAGARQNCSFHELAF